MKIMKTNSKEVRNQIKLHIWECVYDENENKLPSFEAAAKRLWSEFKRVGDNPYERKRNSNEQARFSYYLDGLPFHFHFYYSDIKEFLDSLGINPTGKEFSDERSHYLYHYLIYTETKKAAC